MCRWIDVMTESSEARLDESDDQKQSVTTIRGGSVGKLMERDGGREREREREIEREREGGGGGGGGGGREGEREREGGRERERERKS